MNKRQEALMNEFLSQTRAEYTEMLRDLAEYAIGLGYSPIRCRTKDLTIDFRCSRRKATIMKMEIREQRHDGFRCGERNMPGLRMKFFAAKEYSLIFQKGIQRVIEDFDGRYTGCYGCGRCRGGLEGYMFQYPDGRQVFRCGRELIPIFDFGLGHMEEIKHLMKLQAAYFEGQSESDFDDLNC